MEEISGITKMWISFAGIIFLVVAVTFISLSRYKLKGWLAKIVSFIAYMSLFLATIIIFYIVFSGPSD